MKAFKIIISLSLALLMSGCAMHYRAINPQNTDYRINDVQNNIGLSYKYGVLNERGNTKMAKKEFKNGVQVVAVKITNNSDTTLIIGDNAYFFSGNNIVNLLDPLIIKNSLKQATPAYLCYLLFTPFTFYVGINGNVSSFPLGLILGPVLTLGNMLTSSNANNKMLDELKKYNLKNKAILKGETVYGIIGIQETTYIPLTLKKIKK